MWLLIKTLPLPRLIWGKVSYFRSRGPASSVYSDSLWPPIRTLTEHHNVAFAHLVSVYKHYGVAKVTDPSITNAKGFDYSKTSLTDHLHRSTTPLY